MEYGGALYLPCVFSEMVDLLVTRSKLAGPGRAEATALNP